MSYFTTPRIDKLILNMTVGKDSDLLEKGKRVFQEILPGRTPTPTLARKNIKDFGIKRGLQIGWMLTIRGAMAQELFLRIIALREFTIPHYSIGISTINFGVKNHMDLTGLEYPVNFGIFGLDVSISFTQPGIRIARRRRDRVKFRIDREIMSEYILNFLNNLGIKII